MNNSGELHTVPYVGVRSYDSVDKALFAGRDADVATVADLVADKERCRILLLHGLSGSGKSSFLKAGLIPEITSPSVDTAVYNYLNDRSDSVFIRATDDPFGRLAEAAMEVFNHLEPSQQADIAESHSLSRDPVDRLGEISRNAKTLAQLFLSLAPHLKRPLLLIVDQAEELFTIRSGQAADQASTRFFDFLAEFCLRPCWIQLLLSMRTEFYGRFDAEIRRRLGGSAPVMPFFLRPLTGEMLAQVVIAPSKYIFVTADGLKYKLRYEEGLAEVIAVDLVDAFPGPGALTCLQIVCSRLAELALVECTGKFNKKMEGQVLVAYLTKETYQSIRPIPLAIEDVIDQEFGAFCDKHRLAWTDAITVWRSAKWKLNTLIKSQADGVPVTAFMLKENFHTSITEEFRRRGRGLRLQVRLLSLSWPKGRPSPEYASSGAQSTLIDSLIDFLVERHILRIITVEDRLTSDFKDFLALGHDVLAVGIEQAGARRALQEERLRANSKKSTKNMVVSTLVAGAISGLIGLALPVLFARFSGQSWSYKEFPYEGLSSGLGGVLFGVYAAFLGVAIWEIKTMQRSGSAYTAEVLFDHLTDASRDVSKSFFSNFLWQLGLVLKLVNAIKPGQISRYGLLFRKITGRERTLFTDSASDPFPGAPRF
ncbi:UNVERIFIED_ORG: hypothetical protein J2Y81_002152 [Paraburkholderia sediminicola]|uniref:ATP-binding protein n=1 Tax=Paraburkholderia aspalathi TaxID=1324617 RepID=UPI0021137A0D|nr:hypothetical protein [Paraburkholderia sediminicola]